MGAARAAVGRRRVPPCRKQPRQREAQPQGGEEPVVQAAGPASALKTRDLFSELFPSRRVVGLQRLTAAPTRPCAA